MSAVFADVEFDEQSEVSNDLRGEDTIVCRCCECCEKEVAIFPRVGELVQSLLRSQRFYCTFCVRHDFHTKKRKNVLMMSFRGIISHLYYHGYMIKDPALYLAQIEDMVASHVQIGLLNPVFFYDPESYCWFIDFAKVGNQQGQRRIPLSEVLNTVNEILTAFNLYKHLREFQGHKLVEKFDTAITEFHAKRYRPPQKKLLVPTLTGCFTEPITPVNAKKQVIDYRAFSPKDLRLH